RPTASTHSKSNPSHPRPFTLPLSPTAVSIDVELSSRPESLLRNDAAEGPALFFAYGKFESVSTPKTKSMANAMLPCCPLPVAYPLNPHFSPRRLRHPAHIARRQHPNPLRLHRLHRKPILRQSIVIVHAVPHRLHHRRKFQVRILHPPHAVRKGRNTERQHLRHFRIALQRNRVKHPDHPIRPISAIDPQRIARPRIARRRNPLPHQVPHTSALKLRPHSRMDRCPPAPPSRTLPLPRFHVQRHQLLQLRRNRLRQASLR